MLEFPFHNHILNYNFKFFSKMHFDVTKNFQIEYMGLGPDTAQVQKLNFHSLSTMGQAKAGAHQ